MELWAALGLFSRAAGIASGILNNPTASVAASGMGKDNVYCSPECDVMKSLMANLFSWAKRRSALHNQSSIVGKMVQSHIDRDHVADYEPDYHWSIE